MKKPIKPPKSHAATKKTKRLPMQPISVPSSRVLGIPPVEKKTRQSEPSKKEPGIVTNNMTRRAMGLQPLNSEAIKDISKEALKGNPVVGIASHKPAKGVGIQYKKRGYWDEVVPKPTKTTKPRKKK